MFPERNGAVGLDFASVLLGWIGRDPQRSRTGHLMEPVWQPLFYVRARPSQAAASAKLVILRASDEDARRISTSTLSDTQGSDAFCERSKVASSNQF